MVIVLDVALRLGSGELEMPFQAVGQLRFGPSIRLHFYHFTELERQQTCSMKSSLSLPFLLLIRVFYPVCDIDFSKMVKLIAQTTLCRDPPSTHRLNADAYQQDAITTFRGWQYAAVYTSLPDRPLPRHVTLMRRKLKPLSSWESLTFDDYDQTTDDGHNTISMGICADDGTIHISFDHHCDPLKYRTSVADLASEPEAHEWTASKFSHIMSSLPGLPPEMFKEVTYPRFVRTKETLLFECRTGKAGAGSDMLFVYYSVPQTFRYLSTYLVGVNNNPYINGLSYNKQFGHLHVSWTYRGFVDYEGANDASSSAHKAQAGPNGPENNYDLMYMFSDDDGESWQDNDHRMIAQMADDDDETEPHGSTRPNVPTGVFPDTKGIVVQNIPKHSGIMNQEGQSLGVTNNFHVLNRDNTSGEELWRHFVRTAKSGTPWTSAYIHAVKPTETGPRGKVIEHSKTEDVYLVLPGNLDSKLTVLRRLKDGEEYEIVWQEDGYDGEPLLDEPRFLEEDEDGVLSVFTRTKEAPKEVVVLDFDVS